MMNSRQLSGFAALFMAGLMDSVCTAASSDTQDIAAIRKVMASRYPEVQVTDVLPSAVPGIYSVFSADSIVYTDRTGEYLIVGPMIATRTKTDLSKQALDDRDTINFAELRLDKAIKTVRGTGERTVAVFADPDCPYCHNREKELAGLSDITVYTFLYPLTSLHPDAKNKSHAIWCAQDRSAAWHDWMILDKAPPAPTNECTQDPVDEVLALGSKLKIFSTPVIFLESGHRVSGSRTAAELNALMGTAHTEKPRAAANLTTH
jgi:thiol:disulfide interchange protein DsbC